MKTNTVLHVPLTFTPFTVGVMIETDIEYQILHAALNITELQDFRPDDVKRVTDAVYYALEKGIQLSDETAPIDDISRRKGILRYYQDTDYGKSLAILQKNIEIVSFQQEVDYIQIRCLSPQFDEVELGEFVPFYEAQIDTIKQTVTFTRI